jgi:hypothetical protein
MHPVKGFWLLLCALSNGSLLLAKVSEQASTKSDP